MHTINPEAAIKLRNDSREDSHLDFPGILLGKATIDRILKEDRPSDLIALLVFLHHTGSWQETNRPKATVAYIAKALKWGERKVRDAKSTLTRLQLIRDVKYVNPETRIIKGWFVEVFHFHPCKFGRGGIHAIQNPQSGMQPPKCLSNGIKKCLSTNNDSSKCFKTDREGKTHACVHVIPSEYSEEEREKIELYHKIVVREKNGWLPVDQYSEEVCNALARIDLEGCRWLFSSIASDKENWPERRTLVRLLWDSY